MARRLNYKLKRRNTVINLDEIAIGDQVDISDSSGSAATGEVGGSDTALWVAALGTTIHFARRGKDHWQPAKGVRVVGHIPSMFPTQV